MTAQGSIERMETGVPNLDAMMHGGLPRGTVTLLAGPPGAGKTILAQQLCFHHASQGGRALLFNTLSIPTAKTLLYLRPFAFFDQALIEERVHFVDLGLMLRTKGLELTCNLIMEEIKRFKPSIVVIDSFKIFDDLAQSREELRKFTYELTVKLMAWECTSLLLGEYDTSDFQHPAFSAIDGIITMKQVELSGEQQRFLRIIKLRGTAHSQDAFPFTISKAGIEIYAPALTVSRPAQAGQRPGPDRCKTAISKLDGLLGEGIPWGAGLIVSGVAGTGKTVLGLEFVYRGARELGQKGIFFSFEETEERLRATARGLGWELDREIERGMVELVFVPQPSILVDSELLMMRQRMQALGARRVVVDSLSVFLYKIKEPKIARDKVFQLVSMIQAQEAVGLFTNDIPYGVNRVSRFGVEETVVDGVILLRAEEEGLDRQRYVEIFKLRNTAHANGRHAMSIGPGGIRVFPRSEYPGEPSAGFPAEGSARVSSGVAGLDALLGGGVLEGSVTLVSGSPGTGKSTLGLQFALEGARSSPPALFISLEEGQAQLVRSAESLGLPLQEAIDAGRLEVLHLSRESLHGSRFLSLLSDEARIRKVGRVVLDSAGDIEGLGSSSVELQKLMYSLLVRFRAQRVTSLVTVEARSMFLDDGLGECGLSPLADNLVMFRYILDERRLIPTVTVVKARGSPHDRGSYRFEIGRDGLRIDSPGKGRATSSSIKSDRARGGRKKKR